MDRVRAITGDAITASKLRDAVYLLRKINSISTVSRMGDQNEIGEQLGKKRRGGGTGPVSQENISAIYLG
jgi:hypothetical protein